MSSASFYPPALMLLPIQILERLPPSVQAIDLEALMVVHCILSLIPSFFSRHPSYSLPLSLAGLISTHPSLTSLTPHILFLWGSSIPMDLFWLFYKTDIARTIVIACVGANLILKMASAGLMANVARDEGYIAGGAERGMGGGGGWGSAAAGVTAGGLGGFWSGTGGQAGSGSLPGGYSSIYDEEEARVATEQDAPTVRL